jgi:hypothetical protein
LLTFMPAPSPISGSCATSRHCSGMMKTAAPSDGFPTNAVQFEDAKASQSDGGDSFKLSLCASVKVSLMVMSSIGTNARSPSQHRGHRHQWITCLFLENSRR